MRLLIVTPSFYPATRFGGPIAATRGLCNAISKIAGIELRVLTTDTAGIGTHDRLPILRGIRDCDGYQITYCHKDYGADFSVELLRRLPPDISWADVVHLVGVYSPITMLTLAYCKIRGKPIVWTPNGAFRNPERGRKVAIKQAWLQVCTFLLPRRMLVHFASDQERSVASLRSNIAAAVIPHGVDCGEELQVMRDQESKSLALLFVGRLHPVKGIENLLRAMSAGGGLNSSLDICGDGERDYILYLRSLVKRLGLEDRVTFQGHVEENEKKAAFRRADVVVLPSHSESFGIAVIEALAHGRPVIVSRGTPWSELEVRGCGLWVNNDPGDLAAAIATIGKMDVREMGKRGRDWMRESFAWHDIAVRTVSLYRDLLDRRD